MTQWQLTPAREETVTEMMQPDVQGKTVHAFTDDVLADHDAVALATLIRAGEISAREVCEAAVKRAERVNPALNAIELECFASALERSRFAAEGVLAGVPSFIKDNTDLAGLPTNHGSLAVRAQPALVDGPFAKQLLSTGLVVLGKSRLPEFGFNASTEFAGRAPTRNPWQTDFSAGASSGGSAALVAAGVVPIAHANDGGGSIRIPAACCGLVGLKLSRGRHVDGDIARSLPVNIVSEGVVTRSVRDTAYFFAGLEQAYCNPALKPVGLVQRAGKQRLRVGLVLDSITGHRTDNATRDTVIATSRLLEGLGHRVEEFPLPISPGFASDFSIYWGLLSFLTARFGKKLMSPDFDAARLDGLSRGLASFYLQHFHKTPMVLYRLRRTAKEYASLFRQYDVVLSPVLAHTTPRLGYLAPEQPFEQLFERLRQYVSFTPLNNAAGGPAISLPMGATSEGLPIAVHASAGHGEERMLLELAYELEEAMPWRRIQDVTLR